MTDQDQLDAAGLVLAHAALLTSMLGVLQARNLITQSDVNEVVDLALVGVENTADGAAAVRDVARRALEEFARTMGGKVP